uniref:Uncharacterized protein n=1 Tax=viral metagenome TaxID=1070528 RepID=A0A6M3LYR0_9ZZZZ
MAYSNRLLKGVIGFNPMGWASIVMERAKSDKPSTPVLCEVWGMAHECGSMYYEEFTPTKDIEAWKNAVIASGGNPDDRYFKGDLITIK